MAFFFIAKAASFPFRTLILIAGTFQLSVSTATPSTVPMMMASELMTSFPMMSSSPDMLSLAMNSLELY